MVENELTIHDILKNKSDNIVKYYGFKESENHVTMKLERCHADLLKFRKNY